MDHRGGQRTESAEELGASVKDSGKGRVKCAGARKVL